MVMSVPSIQVCRSNLNIIKKIQLCRSAPLQQQHNIAFATQTLLNRLSISCHMPFSPYVTLLCLRLLEHERNLADAIGLQA